MENKPRKCYNKNHKEIDAISYCEICKVYMCNKCECFHSELCGNHLISNINKDNSDIFTGYCKEKEHFIKLKYFCKNHNRLCCAACIAKIKGEGDGQHADCEICLIEDIKEIKKNKLKENIKYLEDLSINFQESIDKLKQIYENINSNKEELKLNIQKIFTKIRNEINVREDKILNEVDKKFDEIYFDENLLKKGEKIIKQIKSNLDDSKILDKDWEDNNKLNSLISDCINIENNLEYITEINKNVKKYNSLNMEIKFCSEDEIIINSIKNFGKVNISNKDGEELIENVLKKSKIIENEEQIVMLKEWLPYKNKNNIKCKLIYDAKRDGDKVSTFHSLCDNKEATITIISTSNNKKIGGYLSKSFGGNKGNITDNNAFLFSLNYNEKYPSLNEKYNYQDQNNRGPIFGNICIEIKDMFLSNNKNYYRSYTSRYDFGKRHNNKDIYFTVLELEIYQITNHKNLDNL